MQKFLIAKNLSLFCFLGVMSYLHSFMLLSPKQSMEIDIPTSPSLSKPLYDIEDAFRNYLEHHGVIELPKTPSLLAMNHVANLVSYLVRKCVVDVDVDVDIDIMRTVD